MTSHSINFNEILSNSPFGVFWQEITKGNVVEKIEAGLIGKDAKIKGPFGVKPLIYADYVASGRSIMQVEKFILEAVLPYYANSHTEASYCGGFMTGMRKTAREIIKKCVGANDDHAVVFTGSGATAAINRLVHLFGVVGKVESGLRPYVLIGPYEHHSNILPWRETGAEIIEVPEAEVGGPDVDALQKLLGGLDKNRPIIGSFSAASNVTGIQCDVLKITQILKTYGAKVIWDYACAAPYVEIDMEPAPGALIDAIVMSPHKFPGGPGASGLMVIRRCSVETMRPTWPGGGTVTFVSPTRQDYSTLIETREEAGTPNVIGDIRAALAFLVKAALGLHFIEQQNRNRSKLGLAHWGNAKNIEILGSITAKERLPIFSFRVADGAGGFIHQQLFTRMLSDIYGIQARGGCACAGPYVHQLLAIDDNQSEAMRDNIQAGDELSKPGFIRLNLCHLMNDADVEYILASVSELAEKALSLASHYDVNASRAIFSPKKLEYI